VPRLVERCRWACIGVIVGSVLACGGNAWFMCEGDGQCVHDGVAGSCVDGTCAFPDETCASGLRYGTHSGVLGGQCVPPPDAESDTGVADDGTTSSTGAPGDTTEPGSSSGGGATESTSATSGSDDGDTEGGDTEGREALRNYVFVSSGSIVPANLGGLAGADAFCQASARAASLPGTYVAWLSTTSVDALDRLGDAQGWARLDGRPFARSVDDLALNDLLYPVRLDEFGVDQGPVGPATATKDDGTYLGPSDCDGYTSSMPQIRRGIADGLGSPFTSSFDSSCSSNAHLYCFGIDDAVDLPLLLEPTERRAFVTSVPMAATAGVAAFDEQCQSDADTAGLPGTFLALVATSSAAATDRFDLDGAPWSMVNDVQVVESAADLAQTDPVLRAPIWRDAFGMAEPGGVFTGSLAPGALDDLQNCGDWGDATGSAIMGFRVRAAAWWNATTAGCSESRGIYCLQE
jgi:hypothetical protein